MPLRRHLAAAATVSASAADAGRARAASILHSVGVLLVVAALGGTGHVVLDAAVHNLRHFPPYATDLGRQ